ncbi:MAG: FmdB family transcriptional regulator [Anaerolineae bacterium CG03_land_8_20_14_0_80_58_20]|nr:MAG: hypothetical protein AUJ21_07400 [Anaerolineae bacterium CG1_02_58_13]PIV26280.1 MAG: FmdB family transcriptional regulator [Anaerolineae bacterium CG03_land_8_20_14_0_80_58_20]
MPIYEYVCQSCKKEFETIRPMSQKDAAIACEKCGSEDVKRKLALFYAHSGGSAKPVTSGGGGCGSCSGGDCGNCGH